MLPLLLLRIIAAQVHEALAEEMAHIHALSIKRAWTPEQSQQQQQQAGAPAAVAAAAGGAAAADSKGA